ncbi:MAG TPA: efflux RND transporter periplasmic adaptor subunit [Polyangia bacterium]
MHHEVTSTDPRARCPKCNMFINEPVPTAASVPAAPAPAGVTLYRCPMHCTDATSTDPNARCPMCKMRMSEPVPAAALPAAPAGAPTGAAAAAGTVRGQLIGVRRARVERRPLTTEVRATAVVTADEKRVAHIHTKLSGWITRLMVAQTGAEVRRGQPLLAIYSEELYRAQQDYLTLRRSVGGIADSGRAELIAAARRRLQLLDMPAAAIAAIETSGVPSRDVVLRSPQSGFVLARTVVQGSFVQPETDLFTVVDLSRVWLIAEVYEQDVAGLRAGTPGQVTLAAYPGETVTAKVAYVYPSVAGETRTTRVRLELPNPQLKLKPGMFGTARFDLGGPATLVVPAEAVLSSGERRYAFVVRTDGSLEPRAVTVGRRAGAELEILSGLAAGEEVVASAGFLFDSESALRASVQSFAPSQAPRPSAPNIPGGTPVPAAPTPNPHAGHGR